MPNCYYRVSVKALVLDKTRTKFLLIKEENGLWELPGSGLDHGMATGEELKREIHEEMGLETTWIADKPSYFLTSRRTVDNSPSANIIYETKLKDLDFTPSDGCVELRLVSIGEAKELDLFENVKVFLEMFRPENHD